MLVHFRANKLLRESFGKPLKLARNLIDGVMLGEDVHRRSLGLVGSSN